MIFGIIIALVAAVVTIVTVAQTLSQLTKARKSSDKNFSKDPVGEPIATCPLKDKKLLSVEWDKDEAMCGDDVVLKGTARNYDDNTNGTACVFNSGKKIDAIKAKGQNSFILPWKVKDVVFKGQSMPDKYELDAELSACGEKVKSTKPLILKRVPDHGDDSISWSLTAGIYGWKAAFRISIVKDVINVKQTLQIKKAWLGKWISFDQVLDSRSGWGWVKKVGASWQYYDTSSTPKTWKNLPRAISGYTIKNVVFIKSGSDYVSRDNAANKWPESFVEPANYAQKKTDWLANIHSVWDNKFVIKRKNCESSNDKCCKWKLKFKVNWSDTAGDKLIYAIWAQGWERSNAKDWYLTEDRLGVAGHECGHLLGAYDEYTGGAVAATNKIEDESIMGQNLTKAKPRHLKELGEKVAEKINGWIGKSWEFEIKDK